MVPAGKLLGSAAARWAKLSSNSYSGSWERLSLSCRTEVKKLVADSKKRVQMHNVREQMARDSSLPTGRFYPLPKARSYKHQ